MVWLKLLANEKNRGQQQKTINEHTLKGDHSDLKVFVSLIKGKRGLPTLKGKNFFHSR